MKRRTPTLFVGMLGFAALTPTYLNILWWISSSSPDGAQQNPGTTAPDSTLFHPGYTLNNIVRRKIAENAEIFPSDYHHVISASLRQEFILI